MLHEPAGQCPRFQAILRTRRWIVQPLYEKGRRCQGSTRRRQRRDFARSWSGRWAIWSSFEYVTLIGGQLPASIVTLILRAWLGDAATHVFGWRIAFVIAPRSRLRSSCSAVAVPVFRALAVAATPLTAFAITLGPLMLL